jgi:hypothetical protein
MLGGIAAIRHPLEYADGILQIRQFPGCASDYGNTDPLSTWMVMEC